jgi:hypothetical protein
MELRVGGKYKITKRLGSGAFGEIYAGVNVKTNEEVAIKLVSTFCFLITAGGFKRTATPTSL